MQTTNIAEVEKGMTSLFDISSRSSSDKSSLDEDFWTLKSPRKKDLDSIIARTPEKISGDIVSRSRGSNSLLSPQSSSSSSVVLSYTPDSKGTHASTPFDTSLGFESVDIDSKETIDPLEFCSSSHLERNTLSWEHESSECVEDDDELSFATILTSPLNYSKIRSAI